MEVKGYMLNSKGFDLWADGYDKSVGVSEEENTYPFAGYKKVLGKIYKTVMEKEHPVVLDIGFGTGTLTQKLYEKGCIVYGQDFSQKMVRSFFQQNIFQIPHHLLFFLKFYLILNFVVQH